MSYLLSSVCSHHMIMCEVATLPLEAVHINLPSVYGYEHAVLSYRLK